MFVLYMSGRMVPSFQGHGTSAPFSPPCALKEANPPFAKDRQSVDKFSTCARPRGPHAVCVDGGINRRRPVSDRCAPFSFFTFPFDISDPLVSGSADKTIKLWQQHKCLKTYHGHKDAVRALALLTDIGFASGSNDRSVYGC